MPEYLSGQTPALTFGMPSSSHVRYFIVAAILPCFFSCQVLAIPLGRLLDRGSQTLNTGSSNTMNNVKMPIWLPILLVALAGAGVLVCVYTKRAVRRTIGNVPTAPNSGTQEVTAEQLAGGAQDTAGNAGGGNRTRRPRRTRRTPSQISTTSLPAYMKEPGDLELVIFQGAQDMEDVSVLPTIVMPPVTEQDREGFVHSRDNSQGSMYAPMPVTSNDTPLLQNDLPIEDDPSPQDSRNRDQSDQDTAGDGVDNSSSSRNSSMSQSTDQAAVDPRGAAPPYFEVLLPENNDTPGAVPTNALSAPGSESTSTAPTPVPERRRSGFRVLLNAFSGSVSRTQAPRVPADHTRGASSLPVVTIPESEVSQPMTFHRPSDSGGSRSMLNISPFRPLSHQRSNNTMHSNRLTSPSQISLHSISPPLTHTLVRTEFTYPKSGPTPEQLRFISSRESLGRFGLPYGRDAIAFAASTSRQELNPPPNFDAPGSSAPTSRSERPSTAEVRSETFPSSPLAEPSASIIAETIESEPSTPPPLPLPQQPQGEDNSRTSSPETNPSPSVHPTTTVIEPPSPATATTIPPPPSAFRMNFPPDSRASSAMSYATYNTAPESMSGSTTTDEADETDTERLTPVTPSFPQTRHLTEGPDVTITPGTASSPAI